MTITQELAKSYNQELLYFIMIDGLEPVLFQPTKRSTSPATADFNNRTILECLELYGEYSAGFDFKSPTIGASALSFGLMNIYDTNLNRIHTANDASVAYYFAQLFAPGRWSIIDNAHVYAKRSSTWQIDANATTINCHMSPTDAGFASSGTAYIGRETFSYDAIEGSMFTGVTKGIYSCIGTTYGFSYRFPRDDSLYDGDRGDGILITSVPYSWIGRRIALYCTSWDSINAKWYGLDNAQMVWCGTISNEISYAQGDGIWTLSCENIIKQLDVPIGRYCPSALLQGINLLGPRGLRLNIYVYTTDNRPRTTTVQLPPIYLQNYSEVAGMVAYYCNTATWYHAHDGSEHETVSGVHFSFIQGSDGKYVFFISPTGIQNPAESGVNIRYAEICVADNDYIFLPLFVLGFRKLSVIAYNKPGWVIAEDIYLLAAADELPMETFHACNSTYNGGYMYVDSDRGFYSNQGTTNTPRAYITVPKPEFFNVSGVGGAKQSNIPSPDTISGEPYIQSYTNNNVQDYGQLLTLYGGIETLNGTKHAYTYMYIGNLIGNAKPQINNSIFLSTNYLDSTSAFGMGPFELLLYILQSTGASDYNSSVYDKLSIDYGLAIQNCLINESSFQLCDMFIGSVMKQRNYSIPREDSFLDLLKAECGLFGCFLAWRQGKLTMTSYTHPEWNKRNITIGDDTTTDIHESWDIKQSTKNILNQFVLESDYHLFDDKFYRKSTFNDTISIDATGVTNTLGIKHKALPMWYGGGYEEHIQALFLMSRDMLGLPWWEVSTSLSPNLINLVFVGDVVKFTSSSLPDPLGSGFMAITAYGLVTDISWSYETGVGQATLLLFSRYDQELKTPLAPAAMLTNFIAATNTITLIANAYGIAGTDPHDGEAFSLGDYISIYEYAPQNPMAGQTYGPYAVTAAYNTTSNALTISTNTLPAFNSSTAQYAVTYANWTDAAAAQKTKGTWLADNTTCQITTSILAKRWG